MPQPVGDNFDAPDAEGLDKDHPITSSPYRSIGAIVGHQINYLKVQP